MGLTQGHTIPIKYLNNSNYLPFPDIGDIEGGGIELDGDRRGIKDGGGISLWSLSSILLVMGTVILDSSVEVVSLCGTFEGCWSTGLLLTGSPNMCLPLVNED